MDAKQALRELMNRRIKKVMVAALSGAEGTMYTQTFETFRSAILDAANDQIRMLADDLEKFDVTWGTESILFINKGAS